METMSTGGHILAVLEEDAKAPYVQITDRTDVSKSTIWEYIRRLEDDGVIIGYSADIDPKKLTGQSIAMIGIDATGECYVEVTRILKEPDSVKVLYTSSGDHMLMAEVRAVDGDSPGDVISDEALSIDGTAAAYPPLLQERLK